jgi:predicted DNA-binding protein (UPF0251 family)
MGKPTGLNRPVSPDEFIVRRGETVDIQGMPHAEIAKILGISEGTVRSRLFYAHRQLQIYLEEFIKH